MTPREILLLDTLKTHLEINKQPKKKLSVLISGDFSDDFIDNLQKARLPKGMTASFKVDELRSTSSGPYDLVILSLSNENYSPELVKHTYTLLYTGGVLALVANNHSLFQNPSAGKVDRVLSNNYLRSMGLYVLFNEPAGKYTLVHKHKKNYSCSKLGRHLPNSRLYSPFIIILAQRSNLTTIPTYKSHNSIPRRLSRLVSRTKYAISNHKVNDYIVRSSHNLQGAIGFIETMLLVRYFTFKFRLVPNIQIPGNSSHKHTLVIAMTYLQIGGVERVMLNLLKGLDRKTFNIHLVTTVESKNEWHDKFLPYVDSITHIANLIDYTWPVRYRALYLAEFIKKLQPDTLFITNSEAAYSALPLIAIASPGTSVYDLLHTHGTPQDNDAYLRISMPFDKYITRRIVISEYLKNYYCNNYPVSLDKIDVIYNSLDGESLSFNSSSVKTDPLLESINKDTKIISFVGRLESDKSPIRLVEIAKQMKNRSLNGHILVIGDGTLGSQMKSQAKSNGTLDKYISFYGASSNPLSQMYQSDFTLLVSNSEGIPMSVLESMSVRTPAISSAVGGVPEIITDGVDGLLVDMHKDSEYEKIQGFVDAIEKALQLSSPALESMRLASRDKIDQKFSSMEESYKSLFLTGSVTPRDKETTG